MIIFGSMINANDIHKSYGNLKVLDGVDLKVDTGEIVSITGASGAGKTTLLQIIGTLDQADQGIVTIDGVALHTLNKTALAHFRNEKIGFVFQFHQLLPEFTAFENVCIPGMLGRSLIKDTQKRAKELLDYLGLSDKLNNKPAALSGGEQQRAAVARALVNNPKVILADEPSGNLDSENAHALHELFFQLRKDFNQTFVVVTHNESLANMADRKIILQDGKVV